MEVVQNWLNVSQSANKKIYFDIIKVLQER